MDAEAIAKLTKRQRQALFNAVAYLDWAAGEGFCMVRTADTTTISSGSSYMGADDVIYDLWVEFGLADPDDSYTDAVRAILLRDQGDK